VARKITERLEGYAFGVALQEPQHNGPDAIAAEIVFVDDPDPDRAAHTVVVQLTAAGKQRLIAQLTGGIIVA
jgi:hypothetical protein